MLTWMLAICPVPEPLLSLMLTFAELQHLAILQPVILSVTPWRPALTPCHNPATGLLSLRHWPLGQALHNRVWPWGEPGHLSPTPHLATSATLTKLSLLRKPQLPSPPDKFLLLLILEAQVWMSLESRKWEGKWGGWSLHYASTVFISI